MSRFENVLDWIADILTIILLSLFIRMDSYDGGTILFIPLVIIIFFLKCQKTINIKIEPFYIFFLGMNAFIAISSLWALSPSQSLFRARKFFTFAVYFILLYCAYSQKNESKSFFQCIKCAGYLEMLYQIRFYGFSGIYTMLFDAQRMSTILGNSNSIGMAIAYSCVLDFIDIAQRKKLTWTSILIIPAILVAASTQSRKAFITLGLGFVLVFLFYYVNIHKIGKSLFNVCLLGCIFIIALKIIETAPVFSGIYKRMSFVVNFIIGEGEVGGSIETRQRMIELGWQQFLKTPILGIGIDNPRILVYENIPGYATYLHNNYLELLCGGGIIGFFVYYSRFVYMFWILLNTTAHQSEKKACLILIALVLVNDYAMVSYLYKADQMLYILLFLQIEEMRNKEEPDSIFTSDTQCRYFLKAS